MKVFLQFEAVFPLEPIKINGQVYLENELNKLDGYSLPVHKYFSINEEKISTGKLFWNEDIQKICMRFWLNANEVDFFEQYVISGALIPLNVRITPDTVQNKDVKEFFDENINYGY